MAAKSPKQATKAAKKTPKSPKLQPRSQRQVKDAEQAERRQRAMDLRIAGHSYRAIGEALGVSDETARKDVNFVLTRLHKDTMAQADRYRSVQVARHERMIVAHWPVALNPASPQSGAAAAIVQKAEAHLSKLMGTETPIRTEQSVTTSGTPTSLTLNVLPSGAPYAQALPNSIMEALHGAETPEPGDG